MASAPCWPIRGAMRALVGPGAGVGEETRDKVLAILAANKRTVLDADALSSFAKNAEVLFGAIHSPCVLTPA